MAAHKNGKKPGPRSAGRTLAFQVLFGLPFETLGTGGALQHAFDLSPAVLHEENSAAQEFARRLVLGLGDDLDQVDEAIEKYSSNWKLSRIGRVELAILRLAAYEMLMTDMPLRAAMNEAIELAKRFGDDGAPTFVNGILDALAKAIDKENRE